MTFDSRARRRQSASVKACLLLAVWFALSACTLFEPDTRDCGDDPECIGAAGGDAPDAGD